MIRRAVFDAAGYLDESFFLYYDDVEFAYRVKKAGRRIFQVVEAVVVHEGGVSYSGAAPWAIVEGYRSELVFWGRHGSALESLAVRAVNLATFPFRVLWWLARACAGRMDRAALAARLSAHGRGAWLNLTYAAPPARVR